ncbi:hypothetical protein [Dactylosporangium sp. NPDC005555]|uniref:hypothetical protein n=1 Tax=Dactylosporangium sp. NPDC005555 TaxID=3154889 RepID=UPI00339E6D90
MRRSVRVGGASWKRFSNNPTLTIAYTGYPTVDTRATDPSTPCVTGTGRPYVNTTTPTLRAQLGDPEGAAVRGPATPQRRWQ